MDWRIGAVVLTLCVIAWFYLVIKLCWMNRRGGGR